MVSKVHAEPLADAQTQIRSGLLGNHLKRQDAGEVAPPAASTTAGYLCDLMALPPLALVRRHEQNYATKLPVDGSTLSPTCSV
jgi:hypothetical protein